MPATAQHVAFIAPRFAEGATVGGAETLLRRQAQRLVANGRKVSFLTTCAINHFTWRNERPAGQTSVDGMTVRFFPVDEDRNTDAFLRAQDLISRKASHSAKDEMVWVRNSVNSTELYEHLRRDGDQYDRIVIGPYLFGLTVFSAEIHPRKTVLVPCLHDEGFAYAKMIKKMFQTVGSIMFNTAAERDLARRIYDLPASHGAVVGMGLDDFDVAADAFAKRHGLNAPYLLYSGRREGGKGTPLLLEYLNLFRKRTQQEILLVFCGSGHFEAPPDLAPYIYDAGFLSESEKHEAMAGATVFCHPSVNESFGIVLLESWLARTPALVHGQCEVHKSHCLQSNGGLWFNVYPEFEEILMRCLQDPDLRRTLGENGRRYVLREYSWSAVEQRLLAALDQNSA